MLYQPQHEWAWCKLAVTAVEIGYVWTGAAHGAVADALATLAVQNHIDSKMVALYEAEDPLSYDSPEWQDIINY